jgi:uncharacterized membrane protein
MKRPAPHRLDRLKRILRLNYGGLVVGTVFYCLALTPSLLPRPAVFEGLVAGISFAIGYSAGVLGSWVTRRLVRKEAPEKVKRVAWDVALASMAIFILAYGFWAANWQNEVRLLIGEPRLASRHTIIIFVTAFITTAILISIGRLIGWAIRETSKFAGRWVPARFSAAIGTLVVAVLLVLLYNGVLVRAFVTTSNNIYRSQNNLTDAGVTRPTSSLRSGGNGSFIPWQTLGQQGRSFTAGVPSQTQLATFSGKPAAGPIRVYVGLQSAGSAQARADLAVKELERTGAFNRPVLAVMTATGTGWIEPQSAASLEYMWNGNTALATIQYSYLPSWISFLTDQQNATESGHALFDAVYAHWRQLPEGHRPKLIAYGLSLGSYGGQSAFSGVDDLQNRTGGALFIGTPNNSEPWGRFTAARDKGSPQWQPIYQKGKTIRFAAQGADLARPIGPWQPPRIVYLQHASDPVVWWSPHLIWHKPGWLAEKRGPDVTRDMQWYPFVTFAQVTVDQFFGVDAPVGHGHNYANAEVDAWAAIAAPTGWTDAQAQKLQAIIAAYPTD